MRPPYFVFGLPRSRTTWLAAFLSTDRIPCYHEKSMEFASLDALGKFLRQADCGLADTALALRWQWVLKTFPASRIVVVQRQYDEVIASLKSIGFMNPKLIDGLVSALNALTFSGAAMTVSFEDLARRDIVQALCAYLHLPFNTDKWAEFSGMLIEPHPPTLLGRMAQNADNIRALYGDWL